MTLVKNKRTGNWEADIRISGLGRLHVSLGTKKKGDAEDGHAAVKALFMEGNADLIAGLRARKIPIDAVRRVYRTKKPFETLLENSSWPSLGEAAESYLAWMEQTNKAAGTRTTSKSHLDTAIKYFGADKRLDAISHDDVEAWKLDILSRSTGKEGERRKLKPWTASLHLIRLNALFTWVKRQEERRAAREKRSPRLLSTPVDREIIPRKSTPRGRFLDREEAQRLMASTPDQFKFPIASGLLGGLRIGEVCALRPPPQDLNFEVAGGIFRIQRREDWRPKGNKSREVPIATELLALAKAHAEKYASKEWMVPSIDDPTLPMSRSTLEHIFERIVTDAGLIYGQASPVGVTFHTLRHTFASWLAMAGVDLWTIAQLMGHADIKQVQETYGHLSPNHKRLAVDRLGVSYQLGLDAPAEAAV